MFAELLIASVIAAAPAPPDGRLSPGGADGNLGAVERVLAKEPGYREKPGYCLLVFGPKADTRVWLVRDGNTLYVDHNGSGDLTEPGKKFALQNGSFCTVGRITERDGTVHKNLQIQAHNDGTFQLEVGVYDTRHQYVGFGKMDRPSWGDKATSAPVIHFNGPMTLDRYGPVYTVPRGGDGSGSRRYKLRLVVGTPGLGKGTFACYSELCADNLGPIQADIEYPARRAAEVLVACGPALAWGPPVKQRLELEPDG